MRFLYLVVLLFSSALLVSCGAFGSARLSKDVVSSWEVIHEFPGQSADDLFVSLNTWLANTPTKTAQVIDYSDKEAGRIIGKFVFEFKTGVVYSLGLSTVNIDVKDGRAKFYFHSPQYKRISDDLGGEQNYSNPVYEEVDRVGVIKIFREEWKHRVAQAVKFVQSDDREW